MLGENIPSNERVEESRKEDEREYIYTYIQIY